MLLRPFLRVKCPFLVVPRAKKPAARRQRRNASDIGLVAVERSPQAPAPAKAWLALTSERWQTYWGSDIATVAKRDSDLPALTRLFGYYDDLERSLRAFARERFIEGSQGQPKLNPLAAHIVSLEGLIRALEDRFGLSPQARLKLGVDFANAATSLDALNRSMADDDDGSDEEDPRLQVIEGG